MSDDDDHKLVLEKWSLQRPARKYKSLEEIMRKAPRIENLIENENDEVEDDDDDDDKYRGVVCEQCGSGKTPEELLLCDKCDKGFHMSCVRPIVVRVPFGPWFCPSCSGRNLLPPPVQNGRKHRKRSRSLVLQKRRRRFLPFSPVKDPAQRVMQMVSLASALTALNMEFSNELTYMPGMAFRSANNAQLEKDGIQILPKEDAETVENCMAMYKRGEYPPLMVVYDSSEGYTVEADGLIKDMTFIAEYTGDVDYLKNREHDDCDSLMTLISATDPSESLVVCPDKRGNISRFINGVNNQLPESKKRKNVKCVRYDVNGECRVLLVAIRDIARGERLYYDYNGQEHEYPTHHFI